MLQRLFKVEMCWKWQQGAVVSQLPPFPTHINHLTISLHTYKQYRTLSVDDGGVGGDDGERESRNED